MLRVFIFDSEKRPNDDTPGLFRVRITSELADCADLKF